MQEDIQSKVNSIPAVFDDLDLLIRGPPHTAGEELDDDHRPGTFFANDRWGESFHELVGADDRLTARETVTPAPTENPVPPTTPMMRFGQRLGELARAMTPEELRHHPDADNDVLLDLVFGFIRGSCLPPGDLNRGHGDEMVETILAGLNERATTHVRLWERAKEGINPVLTTVRVSNELIDRVGRVLAADGSLDQVHVAVEEASPDIEAAVENIVQDLTEDVAEEVRQRLLAGGVLDEDGVPVDSSWTAADVADDLIRTVIDDLEVEAKLRLHLAFAEDHALLRDKETHGEATFVLTTVDAQPGISSADLARHPESATPNVGMITRIAKDLRGRNTSTDRTTWEARPLLVGDADGWEPTAYGRALAHEIRETTGEWTLGREPLSADVRDEALDELNEADKGS